MLSCIVASTKVRDYVDGSWEGSQDCNALLAFPSGNGFYPARQACTLKVTMETEAIRYGTDLLGDFTYEIVSTGGESLYSSRGRYWAARSTLNI